MTDNDEFTFQDYWANVRSIAKEAMEQDEDACDPTSVEDFIHESVDGSRWVFLHYGARKTLEYSANDEAVFAELGAEAFQGCNTLGEVNVRAAYFALRADVATVFAELLNGAKA